MPLLTSLLLLIVFARLFGRLFERFNQPAIVGEMLSGVLLGPAVLNIVHASEALSGISDLAVFLVVLSAGLEMSFKDIIAAMRGQGLAIAALGFVIPFLSGSVIGAAFGLDAMRTVFLGLCISITALPVAVRILESFNMLDTQIAKYSVATAIVNDLAALLCLGVVLDLPEQHTFQAIAGSVFATGGKLVLLGTVILGFNWFLEKLERSGVHIHYVPERLLALFGSEALLGIVVIFVLVFASVSEILGFHFVIGAFFGALLISKEYFLASRFEELEKALATVTGGFLAPIFFAGLGLEFGIGRMRSAPFVVTVLVVSVLSKVFAGWLGGRMARLPTHEALGLGFILNGRGVMELVVASIALKHGFIGPGLFSTLVLMGVITTMMTPILFRKLILPKMQATGATA